jgi:hypothetical protein
VSPVSALSAARRKVQVARCGTDDLGHPPKAWSLGVGGLARCVAPIRSPALESRTRSGPQQPIKERPVPVHGDPQVLGRHIGALLPLRFQGGRSSENVWARRCMSSATSASACWTEPRGSSTNPTCIASQRPRNPSSSSSASNGCRRSSAAVVAVPDTVPAVPVADPAPDSATP